MILADLRFPDSVLEVRLHRITPLRHFQQMHALLTKAFGLESFKA